MVYGLAGEEEKERRSTIIGFESWKRPRKVTRRQMVLLLPLPPSFPCLPPSSPGFKAILDNSEIQHRVLKELPLLGAIEGFSKIRANRRLSAEEVGKGGREGGDEEGLGSYQSILL